MGSDHYLVMIGDIVGSSRFAPDERRGLQERFISALDSLNARYDDTLLTPLTLTLGDECEAVIADAGALPALIWDIQGRLGQADIRLGFGYGAIHTGFHEDVRRMDGPAFHNAREAIRQAARLRMPGGVFRGFGECEDAILDGVAGLLRHHRASLTERQREILSLLRSGLCPKEVADRLGVSRQRVSAAAGDAGWRALRDGEQALRELLIAYSAQS